jgi:hypothetical protein
LGTSGLLLRKGPSWRCDAAVAGNAGPSFRNLTPKPSLHAFWEKRRLSESATDTMLFSGRNALLRCGRPLVPVLQPAPRFVTLLRCALAERIVALGRKTSHFVFPSARSTLGGFGSEAPKKRWGQTGDKRLSALSVVAGAVAMLPASSLQPVQGALWQTTHTTDGQITKRGR